MVASEFQSLNIAEKTLGKFLNQANCNRGSQSTCMIQVQPPLSFADDFPSLLVKLNTCCRTLLIALRP